MSAGIAIVHEKEDLRQAISEARGAEAEAKRAGKNACGVRIARRSGDTTHVVAPWTTLREWMDLASDLVGLSDRWVHHLVSEQPTLRQLGGTGEPVWRRVQHLVLHGEGGHQPDRRMLSGLKELWASTRTHAKSQSLSEPDAADPEAVDRFIDWCRTAAWLSRYLPAAHMEKP